MAEADNRRENKLKAYPFINSSTFHIGIPNRVAPFCFDHPFHRLRFGEVVWIGQIRESVGIFGPSFRYISKTRSLLWASVTLWRSIATDIYPPLSVVLWASSGLL